MNGNEQKYDVYFVALIVWLLAVAVVATWINHPGIAISAIVTIGAMFGVRAGLRRDAALTARIAAPPGDSWEVRQNGITVGRITDARYAAIQREAGRDPRNAAGQVWNLFEIFGAVVKRSFFVMLVLTYGIVLTMVWITPERFLSGVDALRGASAPDILSGMQQLSLFLVASSVAVVCVAALMGMQVSFTNYYTQDVHRRLRQNLQIAADGQLSVSRVPTDGGQGDAVSGQLPGRA